MDVNLNLLDYILLGFLFIGVVVGFKRGFILSLGMIASALGGIMIAYLFWDDAVKFLEEQYGIGTLLAGIIEKKLPLTASAPLGGDLIPLFDGGIYAGGISMQLSHLILMVLSFLFLLILSSMILKLVFMLLNGLLNHGAIGGINRAGGVVLEVLKYAIIVLVVITVITPLLETGVKVGNNGAVKALACIKESLILDGCKGMVNILRVMLNFGV